MHEVKKRNSIHIPLFHISISEDDLRLTNNTDVWPTGCLIASYYGRLNPDQIYIAENSAMSRPTSPTGAPPLDRVKGSIHQGFYTVAQHVIFWLLCNRRLH
jgi:hypothetical protein